MYTIRRLPRGALDANLFDPGSVPAPFLFLEVASIDIHRWPVNDYMPPAFARVGWNESGLVVYMRAIENERDVDAHVVRTGGEVYRDSCLEFFVMPDPENDPRYLNIETNALGTFLIGEGASREGRRVLDELPAGMNAIVHREADSWALAYTIPCDFIKSEFPSVKFESGWRMRGNFYKCNETRRPHFCMWRDTMAPAPDFHVPDSFGEMVLE